MECVLFMALLLTTKLSTFPFSYFNIFLRKEKITLQGIIDDFLTSENAQIANLHRTNTQYKQHVKKTVPLLNISSRGSGAY